MEKYTKRADFVKDALKCKSFSPVCWDCRKILD